MMPTLLVVALLAQGPIAVSATREARALAEKPQTAAGYWAERPIRSPTFVWIGIGLVAVGSVAAILSVTSEQHSDLSDEQINVRINRDLAPCGSDPDTTNLPIADCKPNYPLLSIGVGMQAAGAAMILYGSRPVTLGPSVAWRVRF
jgi:hypothetical protein